MGLAVEPHITVEYLKTILRYDPELGRVYRTDGFCYTGDHIKISSRNYPVGRICWALFYGEWPPLNKIVDHKDTCHGNNIITNLRLATYTENQQNKAGCGTYPKGVTWRDRKVKPWRAKIRVNGKRLHLGSFETVREAQEAYILAALEHHGEFACLS